MKSPLFLVLGLVLAWTAPALAEPASPPARVVMKVNDEPVYDSELQMELARLAMQVQQMGQDPGKIDLQQIATQQVVDTHLLAQEARKKGLEPDEAKVQALIEQAAAQAGGRDKLAASLAQSGMSLDRYAGILRTALLANAYVEQELMPSAEIKEGEVRAFYETNKEKFRQEETVHARHILIRAEPGADAATKEKARQKAEAIRERALKGEDFAELAKETSEGPSGPRGGDLGFFERKRMVPAFADAAFALKPGEISDVVETRFGYHVIKLEERKPAGIQPYDEVKDKLHAFLQQERVREVVSQKLEELRKQAKIEAVGGEAAPVPGE
ncbi:MAG: peptidylprolyl isomerase [Gammaproteobacteria bacterium]|nr:MAG: peptidylprolyl isomerase [Gammaproteobacteria bacterium]